MHVNSRGSPKTNTVVRPTVLEDRRRSRSQANPAPDGQVPINALVSCRNSLRIVAQPEVILGPDLFGGQVVNVFYLASDYRKRTNYPRFGNFRLKTATPSLRHWGTPQEGRFRLQERRPSMIMKSKARRWRGHICGRAATRTSVKPTPMISRSARPTFLYRVICRHGES